MRGIGKVLISVVILGMLAMSLNASQNTQNPDPLNFMVKYVKNGTEGNFYLEVPHGDGFADFYDYSIYINSRLRKTGTLPGNIGANTIVKIPDIGPVKSLRVDVNDHPVLSRGGFYSNNEILNANNLNVLNLNGDAPADVSEPQSRFIVAGAYRNQVGGIVMTMNVPRILENEWVEVLCSDTEGTLLSKDYVFVKPGKKTIYLGAPTHNAVDIHVLVGGDVNYIMTLS